jgi:HNH endonuclease/NUMOD4 motif
MTAPLTYGTRPVASQEVWAAIPGVDGYEASSFGRVRSLDREVQKTRADGSTYICRLAGRVLKPWAVKNYRAVNVGRRAEYVHRLVCLAFYGPSDLEVAHWDGVPTNNRVENLRWATPTENNHDKRRHGTHRRPDRSAVHGEAHPMAKLNGAQVAEIRGKYKRGMGIVLAAQYGVARSTISRIANGENWKNG